MLIGLALACALCLWANVQVRSLRLPLAAVALVFGGSFVLGEVSPRSFQRSIVKPNELELESALSPAEHRA